MELSQIELAFKNAMDELKFIKGRTFVFTNFVSERQIWIRDNPMIGEETMSCGLSFRDITLQGDVDNLYMPSDYYSLQKSSMQSEIELILSRECLFQIAQAYEVMESFLYNIVAEFILIKSNVSLFIDPKTNTSSFKSIRKGLKALPDRTNNKHLLSIIRSNSSLFNEFEAKNIYDIDYAKWYELLSVARHCIVHNRMVVTPEIKAQLIQTAMPFSICLDRSEEILFVTSDNCSELLSSIAEYIFYVFKSIHNACFNQVIDFDALQYILPDITHKVMDA